MKVVEDLIYKLEIDGKLLQSKFEKKQFDEDWDKLVIDLRATEKELGHELNLLIENKKVLGR